MKQLTMLVNIVAAIKCMLNKNMNSFNPQILRKLKQSYCSDKGVKPIHRTQFLLVFWYLQHYLSWYQPRFFL